MVAEDEVKTGTLFKLPFFTPGSGKNWKKRFFLFNTRTMLLQYWHGEEARTFKIEQAVSGPPRGTISLLSSNLVVEPAPVEKSMFGQKYPIRISNGPAFSGRILILAACSPVARGAWIEAIQDAIEGLKERQKVNVMKRKIITDPNHADYHSLENQYMMVKDKEAQVKNLDLKISRAMVQCELMRSKDRNLYNLQERLIIAHRDIEDKLYSMTQEENNPRRRFKFIKLNICQDMFDELPMGLYRHTAPEWINKRAGKKDNKLNIPEDQMRAKNINEKEMESIEKADEGNKEIIPNWKLKNSNRIVLEKNKEHRVWKLEDKDYHPYVTYNTVVDSIDKQFDDSPKMFLKDAVRGHEIRTFSDGQDYDLKSLREMNVFDLLKSEKLRPYFSYIHRLDQVDTWPKKEGEKFFPTNKKIASEIPKHEVKIAEMDLESRIEDAGMDFDAGLIDSIADIDGRPRFNEKWEERYTVDGSGRRF